MPDVRRLVAFLALVGCGGGDDVDCKMVVAPPATARVVSLSTDQRAQLCDLTACQNGGYGMQRTCSMGPPVRFAGSRGECLGQVPTNPECLATVQDLVNCMTAISASPCASTLLTSDACDAVTQFECLTFRPNAASLGMLTTDRPARP